MINFSHTTSPAQFGRKTSTALINLLNDWAAIDVISWKSASDFAEQFIVNCEGQQLADLHGTMEQACQIRWNDCIKHVDLATRIKAVA